MVESSAFGTRKIGLKGVFDVDMPKEGWSVKPGLMDRALPLHVAEGDSWWVEVGPVSLGGEIVTIQRQAELIAALSRRPDGRLRVASFRPLDRRSVLMIRNLAVKPHAGGHVHRRRDNWEYALDCSALIPSHHSVDAGVSYLAYWRTGIGIDSEGHYVPAWRAMKDLLARPVAMTIAELLAPDCAS